MHSARVTQVWTEKRSGRYWGLPIIYANWYSLRYEIFEYSFFAWISLVDDRATDKKFLNF